MRTPCGNSEPRLFTATPGATLRCSSGSCIQRGAPRANCSTAVRTHAVLREWKLGNRERAVFLHIGEIDGCDNESQCQSRSRSI